MSETLIRAARRTPVMPRGGAFRDLEAWDLGARAIVAALADAGIDPQAVDTVIMGNALYGGGNPARLAALAAGLPESAAAMTLDTQCAGGLDAVAMADALIRAGRAEVVVAGGLESYSRAPIRQRRPKAPGETPEPYDRPPFTPWPDRDPDMLAAAADLARRLGIDRDRQAAHAVESHRRALADVHLGAEIVAVAGADRDGFTRRLSEKACARLPVLAGDARHGVTAATTAVEADAAAALVVTSERAARALAPDRPRVGVIGAAAVGGDPGNPALVPVGAARAALDRARRGAADIDHCELMEAFAVQAIAGIDGIGIAAERVNRRGGALARGHPIGASGAILAVRLWHDLARAGPGAAGLAAIAAAGGLGSALVLVRGERP